MADNYLITGYWGEPHVTAENDRGFNAAIFGAGKFVLPVGEMFRAEYIGNNTVRVYDGKLIDNGALAGIPAGEYIDLLIPEAGQGMNRNDLIIFQYSQDASTLIESGVFVVLSGTETSETAVDPDLTESDLLTNKATFDQMALWRIPVSGTVISDPVQLFEEHGLTNVDNTPDTEKYVKFAQEAGIARGVDSALTIRFNGGRTENTDMWTFDGSTARTVNITPDKIGAAPAGYGLGTGGVYPSAVGVTGCGMTRGGFYRWDASGQSDGFPFVYGSMIVSPRTADTTSFQLAFCHADSYIGTMAARLYSTSTDYPWEYINPPMTAGQAYRTTERWNGKAVYAKLINLGTLQASGLKNHDTGLWYSENVTFIDLRAMATDGTFQYDMNSKIFTAGHAYMWTNTNKWYVNINCESDMSSLTGKAIVKWVYN